VVPVKAVVVNESVSGYCFNVLANCFTCCLYTRLLCLYGFDAQPKQNIISRRIVGFIVLLFYYEVSI
jgi:hypothetical protein